MDRKCTFDISFKPATMVYYGYIDGICNHELIKAPLNMQIGDTLHMVQFFINQFLRSGRTRVARKT